MLKKTNNQQNYFFILNGLDLEMDEIIKILKKEKIKFIMPYEDRAEKVIKVKDLKKYKNDKRIRVYVECQPEKRLIRKNDIYIDHHNKYINRRASLIQVKKLLNLKITQKDLWAEAYDRAGVYGALKVGIPREIVKKWIDINLKLNGFRGNRIKWLNLIKKSPDVNGVKIVKVKLNKDIKKPGVTALIQLYDFLNYPKMQKLLVILYKGKKVIKYNFFIDPKISQKLHKKFGGYIFGDPKLKNVSWGIDQKWIIPKEEEMLEIIKGK